MTTTRSALMKESLKKYYPGMVAALFIILQLFGCATAPRQFEREPSLALELTQTTSLGKIFEGDAAEHKGLSGFSLLNEGRSAFLARAGVADLAERSLDVQYFIWEPDRTGSILLARLIEAAKRGVRVRLLIDDLNAGGMDSASARSMPVRTSRCGYTIHSGSISCPELDAAWNSLHPSRA